MNQDKSPSNINLSRRKPSNYLKYLYTFSMIGGVIFIVFLLLFINFVFQRSSEPDSPAALVILFIIPAILFLGVLAIVVSMIYMIKTGSKVARATTLTYLALVVLFIWTISKLD